MLMLVTGIVAGATLTWLTIRSRYVGRVAAASAEAALLRERVIDLEANATDDLETAALLAPLAGALRRVEDHVAVLNDDRATQLAQVSERLSAVGHATARLDAQTSALVGSLQASTTRGAWGEVQLRRVLEHAGLLARCDFDVQVSGTTASGRAVRPDVVVHLPGERHLVIDAKAPMAALLRTAAVERSHDAREADLQAHAKALRAHVDALAGKAYWTAWPDSPAMVVCYLPAEALLTSALQADPSLFEHAMAKQVVLATPATLLALLRTVAHAWQHESLTSNAAELLRLGHDLYERLGSVGGHARRMGEQLTRTVETYNAMIGSIEHRVLVTARQMHELGLSAAPASSLVPVDLAARPLTAPLLIDGAESPVITDEHALALIEPAVQRPEIDSALISPHQVNRPNRCERAEPTPVLTTSKENTARRDEHRRTP